VSGRRGTMVFIPHRLPFDKNANKRYVVMVQLERLAAGACSQLALSLIKVPYAANNKRGSACQAWLFTVTASASPGYRYVAPTPPYPLRNYTSFRIFWLRRFRTDCLHVYTSVLYPSHMTHNRPISYLLGLQKGSCYR